MSYLYSQVNRLEEPHAYMYTRFQGMGLLRSYFSNRMNAARVHGEFESGREEQDRILLAHAVQRLTMQLEAASPDGGMKFRKLLGSEDIPVFELSRNASDHLIELAQGLERMTTSKSILTLDLMHALISAQLTSEMNANTKIWLDRLVQRFEVSKKLYECYPAGFRKGEGANTSVRLYWLFGLSLCLFYTKSMKLKYLSTILKVNDLLCSLPAPLLQGQIVECGFSAILAAEIMSVELLAQEKGVSIAPE